MFKKYFKKRKETQRRAFKYQELFKGYVGYVKYPVKLSRHEQDLIELEATNTGKIIGFHRFTNTNRVAAYARGKLTDEEVQVFIKFSEMFLGAEIEEVQSGGQFLILKEVWNAKA